MGEGMADTAKTAIVTGGTRGIGAAISLALKEAGLVVAANYAGNDDAARAFTEETGIKAYKWSVADYDACKAGVAQIEDELGPVAVLVNNAGITRDAMFHRMTPQQWKEVVDTNLTGVFNMTHVIWPGMRERKFGRVVTISSISVKPRALWRSGALQVGLIEDPTRYNPTSLHSTGWPGGRKQAQARRP